MLKKISVVAVSLLLALLMFSCELYSDTVISDITEDDDQPEDGGNIQIDKTVLYDLMTERFGTDLGDGYTEGDKIQLVLDQYRYSPLGTVSGGAHLRITRTGTGVLGISIDDASLYFDKDSITIKSDSIDPSDCNDGNHGIDEFRQMFLGLLDSVANPAVYRVNGLDYFLLERDMTDAVSMTVQDVEGNDVHLVNSRYSLMKEVSEDQESLKLRFELSGDVDVMLEALIDPPSDPEIMYFKIGDYIEGSVMSSGPDSIPPALYYYNKINTRYGNASLYPLEYEDSDNIKALIKPMIISSDSVEGNFDVRIVGSSRQGYSVYVNSAALEIEGNMVRVTDNTVDPSSQVDLYKIQSLIKAFLENCRETGGYSGCYFLLTREVSGGTVELYDDSWELNPFTIAYLQFFSERTEYASIPTHYISFGLSGGSEVAVEATYRSGSVVDIRYYRNGSHSEGQMSSGNPITGPSTVLDETYYLDAILKRYSIDSKVMNDYEKGDMVSIGFDSYISGPNVVSGSIEGSLVDSTDMSIVVADFTLNGAHITVADDVYDPGSGDGIPDITEGLVEEARVNTDNEGITFFRHMRSYSGGNITLYSPEHISRSYAVSDLTVTKEKANGLISTSLDCHLTYGSDYVRFSALLSGESFQVTDFDCSEWHI